MSAQGAHGGWQAADPTANRLALVEVAALVIGANLKGRVRHFSLPGIIIDVEDGE